MEANSEASAGQRLKDLRKRAGYTVRELADLVGKTASTYSSYEDKYKKASLPLDLAKALVEPLTARGVKRFEVLQLAGLTVEDLLPEDEELREAVARRLEEVARSAGTSGDASMMVVSRVVAELFEVLKVRGDIKTDLTGPTFARMVRVAVNTGNLVASDFDEGPLR